VDLGAGGLRTINLDMSTVLTLLWIGLVQALLLGGAGRAGRAGAGQVVLSVAGGEGLTPDCKRPTLSVRGGLCIVDSCARSEVTIGSKEQASVWGIVIVKKSSRTFCLGSILALFDGKGEGRLLARVFTGWASVVFGIAIAVAGGLLLEAEGQLEGEGVRS
jgi:hypothetical protein